MAEAPYQTYERVLGKKWTGGTSPEVSSLLRQYNITAPAGSAEANLALQKSLLAPTGVTTGGTGQNLTTTQNQTSAPVDQPPTDLLETSVVRSDSGFDPGGTDSSNTGTQTNTDAYTPDSITSGSLLRDRYGIDLSKFDFGIQPEKSLKDVTMEIMSQTGLNDIRDRITNISKEVEDLENERNGKIDEINQNPWLTEQMRQQKVGKLTDQYEGKINARVNRLRLEESALKDAREEVQFAVQQAADQVQSNRTNRTNLLKDLMDRADLELTARRALEKENRDANKPIEVNGQLVQRQADGSYKTVYGGAEKTGPSDLQFVSATRYQPAGYFNKTTGEFTPVNGRGAPGGGRVTPGGGGGGGGGNGNGTTTQPETPAKPIKLSTSQQDEIVTLETVKNLADKLLGFNADGRIEGVGPIAGRTVGTKTLFGLSSEESRQVQAIAGNIQATIAKLRGGTSFTANEEKLLRQYTPTVTDAPSAFITKIDQLKDFIDKRKANVLKVASGDFSSQEGNSGLDNLRSKYNY